MNKVDKQGLIEQLLLAAATYSKSKVRYPCADLWLLAEDADLSGLDGCYKDGDERCTTRKLNTTWLMPPDIGADNENWRQPYANHISECDLQEVRGMRPIIRNPKTGEIAQVLKHFIPRRAYKLKFFASQEDGKGRMTWQSDRFMWHIAQRNDEFHALSSSSVSVDLRTPDAIETGQSRSEFLKERVMIGYGYQCFTEYLWRVALEFESGALPICIHVDPETVKEILSMRTMAEKEAQKRFVTIVSKHRRRHKERAGDNGGGSDVMRHFRGRVEGLWQGCRVVVTPPVNEIERMEKVTAKVASVSESSRARLPGV